MLIHIRKFFSAALCVAILLHPSTALGAKIESTGATPINILFNRNMIKADMPINTYDPVYSKTSHVVKGTVVIDVNAGPACPNADHTTVVINGTIRNSAMKTWEIGTAGIGLAIFYSDRQTDAQVLLGQPGSSYVRSLNSAGEFYQFVRTGYLVRDGPVNSAPTSPANASVRAWTQINKECMSTFSFDTYFYMVGGTLAGNTCTVANPSQQITLGEVAGNDQPATNNAPFAKGRSPFSIDLNCANVPSGQPVRTTWFDHNAPTSTKNYLTNTALNAPDGLAIQVLKSDGVTPFPMGGTEDLRTGPGTVKVSGVAAYYRTAPITKAGPVTATLGYSITYY